MKTILNNITGSDSKRVTMDDGRVRAYTRVDLSESGYKLIE